LPDVKNKFVILGMDLSPQSPSEFDSYIGSEVTKWSRVIKQAGIEPQ
jgi:tripartite-type tricarboxylate transporter receptor subunit TctC